MANGSNRSATARRILVLDNDPAVREALSRVFSTPSYEVICCANSETLLALTRKRIPDCIILELVLPQSSGIEVLKGLRQAGYSGPVLMISGKGDISNAVAAIKSGAFDFMETPFRGSDIVAKVDAAVRAHVWQKPKNEPLKLNLQLPDSEPLTARERDVLQQLASGLSSKEAGRGLGLSPRTIETYRVRIMRKLGARNVADLLRMVLTMPKLIPKGAGDDRRD